MNSCKKSIIIAHRDNDGWCLDDKLICEKFWRVFLFIVREKNYRLSGYG